MRRLNLLCLLCLLLAGGCEKSAKSALQRNPGTDSPESGQNSEDHRDFSVSDLMEGDWEILSGEMIQTIDGLRRREAGTIWFEVGTLSQVDDPHSIQIKWENDDDQREWGEFFVPFNRDLTLAEYVQRLRGPFGEGEVLRESTEDYRIGGRSFSCRRVDCRLDNEYGSHSYTLWLSNIVPAARVVAYHTRWQPTAAWADRAPPVAGKFELSAFGNRQNTLWSRDR